MQGSGEVGGRSCAWWGGGEQEEMELGRSEGEDAGGGGG